MHCPRCQHENRPQAKFCEACAGSFIGTSPTAQSDADPKSEVEHLRRALTEAQEQQAATSEILRVISSSPTDVQPVFDSIAESATRLCDGIYSGVFRFDGKLMHFVAHYNWTPKALEMARDTWPRPPDRGSLAARAVLDRAVIHVPDVARDPEYRLMELAEAGGQLSILAVPMLQRGAPIGAITVMLAEPRPFSLRQIELVKTFANQAVIAIENVRLFTELQEKNGALTQAHAQTTEALEQQTATGEILRVIASSPTDLQPMMDVVADSAARFCGATDAAILRLEGELLRLVAMHGPLGMPVSMGATFAASRRSVAGRAVRDRQTIHIEDLLALPAKEFPETLERGRYTRTPGRTMLATPLLREGEPIGVIFMWRTEVQPFTDKQIALAKTFADQAVIAIENVRLFNNTKPRRSSSRRRPRRSCESSPARRPISSRSWRPSPRTPHGCAGRRIRRSSVWKGSTSVWWHDMDRCPDH